MKEKGTGDKENKENKRRGKRKWKWLGGKEQNQFRESVCLYVCRDLKNGKERLEGGEGRRMWPRDAVYIVQYSVGVDDQCRHYVEKDAFDEVVILDLLVL